MSSCLSLKFAGLVLAAIGTNELLSTAASHSAGRVAGSLVDTWEKGGMIAVLLVIVAALWLDSKREQKAASEYRERREKLELEKREKADARSADYLKALNELSSTLRENAVKCEVTRQAMERQAKPK